MESITGGSAIRSYEYAFSVSSALPHFAALKAARGNPFLFCGLDIADLAILAAADSSRQDLYFGPER